MSNFYDDSSKNMRDDMNRGADPNELADMGYEVPNHMLTEEEATDASSEAHEITDGHESSEDNRVETVAKKAGDVLCADCLQVIPCVHVGVKRDGSRYTRGH